tara:strand:- start:12385 stop:13143 length:759 start_codon:yes stop_codon:yes gene_type:complete
MAAYGTLEFERALDGALALKSLETEPWTLPGARLIQASVEVERESALAAIPPALHPTLPPYALFSVTEFPESPVGPFRLAQVRIVARAGTRPRGFLVGAVCDSDVATAELAARWGYSVVRGEVKLSERHDRWIGTVVRDGKMIMQVSCRNPQLINGADIDPIDTLTLARYESESLLMQVDPEYVYHAAHRGQAELEFDSASWGRGALAGSVHPTSPNVAVCCRVDTDLPTPRFVIDPAKPALQGTRRLSAAD